MKREAAPPLRGVHVLLVCDDAERRELFKQAIEYGGAFTTAVESPPRALRVMERLQVNVLVVEVTGDDRFACINAVRSVKREVIGAVPAIALTSDFDDRDALLAAGFQAHMTMPVRSAELCEAIATLARATRAAERAADST
jgi:CheY-like chemotaxis protein